MTLTRRINVLEHRGDSSNIAYYKERDDHLLASPVWCEVLRGFNWGAATSRPRFIFTVYREGHGRVGEFTWIPKGRVKAGRLSERTVTKLVREHLDG